ncbi:nucleoporin Nup186/Nup192/Nup205 [Halteromyces radiatus]|uniref:nucleoporin Nup186/Nup192/Nup205 n=1 Tax=Halteromyces radiatus TaxID=101107 RepID=UPI002220F878|nr:nucleoporin Nup186/Nup192/Nup205 [Halteromyces radiatus]KAI8084516.1 nucleoporin Nup186/Nup192/Nup205 [Halteromyces radiatus]
MTAVDTKPTWSHGARNLHDFICKTRLSSSENDADLLLQLLEDNKQRFRTLLDDAPKNTEHRRALQAGNAYIDRALYKPNEEFIKETLLLSDELDINEHVAATLLYHGQAESNRVNSERIYACIELYHTERGYLLACLEIILKSISDASLDDQIKERLLQFIDDIMTDDAIPFGENGPTGTFPSKLLQTAKKLNTMIKSLNKNDSLGASATTTTTTTSTTIGSQQLQTMPTSSQLDIKITAMRIDKLKDERIYLMQILYHLALLFWLKGDDLLTILGYVEKSNLSTLTTPYLSMILMAALSPTIDIHKNGKDMALDTDLVQKCHDKIQQKEQWKVPALRSMITLQWVSFLMTALQRNPDLESKLAINELKCKELASDSMSSSRVFGFMNDYLLRFQQQDGQSVEEQDKKNYVTEDNAMVLDGLTVDPGDYTKFHADIKPDFQEVVVYEIKELTTFIIKHLTDVLRDLNYQQEDKVYQMGTVVTKGAAIVGPEDELYNKQDPELFFTLLASIYRHGKINQGLWFWIQNDSMENSFVKWVIDNIKLVGTMRACFEFFGAISCGDLCAPHAFRFFELGTVRTPSIANSQLFSWGKLFAAIHFYVPLLRQATEACPAEFPPGEEDLLKTFLYLLKQVVQYSGEARVALWNDPVYRVRDSLTELANSSISASLRASLCDVMAAFCSPWGGGINDVGRNISLQIWHIIEHGNVFIIKQQKQKQQQQQQSSMNQLSGFLKELSLEREARSYTETLSALNLLVNLIHTQSKRDELQSGFSPLVSSIPMDLGKETRFPGAQPYISTVIDDVLLVLDDQRYKVPNEKWALTEMCLKILENSVFSFDLSQLLESHVAWQQSPTYKSEVDRVLCYYITHPGFEVIMRILSGATLIGELFKIIERGRKAIINSRTPSKSIPSSLVRCLRILFRVMQLQDAFGNLLVPDVLRSSTRLPSGNYKLDDLTFAPWPSLAPVGNHMLCSKSVIVQLAELVDFGDYEEICYLSSKILHGLSMEPSTSREQYDVSRVAGISHVYGGLGSQLAELLAMSDHSYDIIRGISERFGIEQPERTTYDDYDFDINNIPFWMATQILNNKYRYENDFDQQFMTSSVRVAILDMLLDNAPNDKPSPNLTEFLLGIEALTPTRTSLLENNDRHHTQARGAKLICLHAILDMLRANLNVSSLEQVEYQDQSFLPLTATHPVLAEKCYQLIYRLCARKSTSFKLMQYLRLRDDYFYNQLEAMLSTLSVYTLGNNHQNTFTTPGAMVFTDGSKVTCDMIHLRSELHQRAWRLKTIAIELHVLFDTKSKTDATRLLNLLYGDDDNNTTTDQQRLASVEEPFTSFMDLPTTLDFTWEDDLIKKNTLALHYFDRFDAKLFQTTSVTGCKVNDIRSIYGYLRRQQRNLQQAGTLMMDTDNWAAEKEMGDLLRHVMADNHAREIQHGQHHCFDAWLQVIQITVIDNFDFLPPTKRERILGVLMIKLVSLLTKYKQDEKLLMGVAHTLLLFMQRLHHEDHPATLIHQQLYGVFENLVRLMPSMPKQVRPILYAAMVHLVQTLRGSTLRLDMLQQLAKLRADTLPQ